MTTTLSVFTVLPWILGIGALVVGVHIIYYLLKQVQHIKWLEKELYGKMGIGFEKPSEKIIAEQKKEIEMLIEQNELLNQRNKGLEEFAFTVSHDLKSPLRNSRSFLDLLTETGGDVNSSQNREYIEYISESLSHSLNLVAEILGYSRRYNAQKSKEWVPLNEVMRSVLCTQANSIRENEVTLQMDGLPSIWGHKLSLTQLFQNLVNNAIKYNDKEFPQIQISFVEQGDAVWFMVQDNGCGIDEEASQKIFELFQRQKGQKQEGSGIGLAICKRIVDEMNGDIWVESMPHKGSTFFISLSSKLISKSPQISFDIAKTA